MKQFITKAQAEKWNNEQMANVFKYNKKWYITDEEPNGNPYAIFYNEVCYSTVSQKLYEKYFKNTIDTLK